MNISLTKELEKYLQMKVRTGLYTSISEVVREGLRLLQEQDRLKVMRLTEQRNEPGVGTQTPVESFLGPAAVPRTRKKSQPRTPKKGAPPSR